MAYTRTVVGNTVFDDNGNVIIPHNTEIGIPVGVTTLNNGLKLITRTDTLGATSSAANVASPNPLNNAIQGQYTNIYTSDFNNRGFDGWQTFNQFSETIYYNSLQLGYESNRGTCLVLSTSHNFNDLTMVRWSPGTPSIPLNATAVEFDLEISYKAQDKNFPYAFRFGLDCQPNENRGWAMAEYRINTLGQTFAYDDIAGSTRELGSSWRVNSSPNDTLNFLDFNNNWQNIPANEPGKPTIVTCGMRLKFQGSGASRQVLYDTLHCNGKIMDISGISIFGETIHWDYNEGMNVLIQAVNRPTNYSIPQTSSNHMNLFVHSANLRFIY